MTPARPSSQLAAILALPILAACGGGDAPKPPPAAPGTTPPVVATTPPASSAPTPPAAAQTSEEGHKLVVLAAGCWFGGVWADALGEQGDQKKAGIDIRCTDLVKRVYDTDEQTHVEQVRALETKSIGDFVAKVDATAKGDSVDGARKDMLVKLAQALAEAQKEAMAARRAADRVKRDLAREPEKLSQDEVEALVPMRTHTKMDALTKLDAGDLTKEAHALGVMCAMDRVELARGLPKHMKVYAVADAFNLLFDLPPPDVPQDPTKKLVPGTWLTYLVDAAKAAGHPVPESAKTPRDRDALAWAGMLEGISDKLKGDVDGIGQATDLSKVVPAVLHRLETEFRAQSAARPPGPAPKKH
jgi:hypothetical protein